MGQGHPVYAKDLQAQPAGLGPYPALNLPQQRLLSYGEPHQFMVDRALKDHQDPLLRGEVLHWCTATKELCCETDTVAALEVQLANLQKDLYHARAQKRKYKEEVVGCLNRLKSANTYQALYPTLQRQKKGKYKAGEVSAHQMKQYCFRLTLAGEPKTISHVQQDEGAWGDYSDGVWCQEYEVKAITSGNYQLAWDKPKP